MADGSPHTLRWIRRAALCLLLGLIATLAVAWACAWWLPIRVTDLVDVGTTSTEHRTWLLSIYRRGGAEWIDARAVWDIDLFKGGRYTRITSQIPDDVVAPSDVLSAPPEPSMPFDVRHVMTSRGWPFLALAAERTLPSTAPAPRTNARSRAARGTLRAWSPRLDSGRALLDTPLIGLRRPLWTGLVANTTVYAAAWAVVLFVLVPVWIFLGRRGRAGLVAVSLGMAIVTTIAAAWACAWSIDVHEHRFPDERVETDLEDGGQLVEHLYHVMGAHRVYTWVLPPDRADGEPVRLEVLDRRGWPWPALECTLHGTSSAAGQHALERIAGGLRLRSAERDLDPTTLERIAALPLRPFAPGFALNVFTLGVCWWLLLSVALIPRWARSVYWIRRGQCAWCGYRLADEQQTCPECGRTP